MPACPALQSMGPSLQSMGPSSDIFGPKLMSFQPVSQVPDFTDDMDKASLLAALAKSLAYWGPVPEDRPVRLGDTRLTAGKVKRSVAALADVVRAATSPKDLLERVRASFDAYKSIGSDGNGLVTVTAYYEAELDAVPKRDAEHPFGILLKPADLVRLDSGLGSPFDYGRVDARGRVVPHMSRAEISGGGLAGKGLEMAWTAHPTDLLILQTEGSGFLNLPGGVRRRVGFDGANGWPFRSVGRTLIECGVLPPGSTGKPVLDFLRRQPRDREAAYVALNPRYVFFKMQDGAEGSYGAIGQILTAGRSIAIDPAVLPMGSAGLLISRIPVVDADGNVTGTRPFTRLVAMQDTGSAIRGPGRVDLFLGSGREAGAVGHSMFHPGTLYVFILKR